MKLLIASVVFACSSAASAFAWGNDGHQIIGHSAYALLAADTAAAEGRPNDCLTSKVIQYENELRAYNMPGRDSGNALYAEATPKRSSTIVNDLCWLR